MQTFKSRSPPVRVTMTGHRNIAVSLDSCDGIGCCWVLAWEVSGERVKTSGNTHSSLLELFGLCQATLHLTASAPAQDERYLKLPGSNTPTQTCLATKTGTRIPPDEEGGRFSRDPRSLDTSYVHLVISAGWRAKVDAGWHTLIFPGASRPPATHLTLRCISA